MSMSVCNNPLKGYCLIQLIRVGHSNRLKCVKYAILISIDISLITCQTDKCNLISVFKYIETYRFDESTGSHFSDFFVRFPNN